MDQAKRDHLSTIQKLKWANCEAIALHLNVSKMDVNNYLYSEIVQAGKLAEAAVGDTEIIAWIKTTASWGRFQKYSEIQEPYSVKRTELVETVSDQLKIAMWFLKKFESYEEAKAALEIAHQAINKLRKRNRGRANTETDEETSQGDSSSEHTEDDA